MQRTVRAPQRLGRHALHRHVAAERRNARETDARQRLEGADPAHFVRAERQHLVRLAKNPPVKRRDQPLLPARRIVQPSGVEARLRHDDEPLAEALRHPSPIPDRERPAAMHPDLVHVPRRASRAHRKGEVEVDRIPLARRRKQPYLIPSCGLDTGKPPRDVRDATRFPKPRHDMQDLHNFTLQHMPTTSTFSFPKTSLTARVTPKRGFGLP